MIEFDFTTYMKNYDLSKFVKLREEIESKLLNDKMTSWYDLSKCLDKKTLTDILNTSRYIQNNCEVFLVIGAGGSVLGSKGVIEALSPYFKKDGLEIIYLGTSLSSFYFQEVIEYIKDKQIVINVITKSGTTLETNLYFASFKNIMAEKYSEEELQKRIIITTDAQNDLVIENNYKSFVFPKDIGGRFSTLTVVGLLPMAVRGINIMEILKGASDLDKSKAFEYAFLRHCLYKDKQVESFTIYEPKLKSLMELFKQLMAETQGKDGKGLLPILSINTNDLHSMGQFYQEGNPLIFETVLRIKNTSDIYLEKYNKTLAELNNLISDKVAESHYKNTTYSNIITLNELSPYVLGQLIYFMEIASAVGAYLLEVNPFDQPGVKEYKDLLKGEFYES